MVVSASLNLESIATKQALSDAGVQVEDFTLVEKVVHRAFNDVLYVFYPAYTQFYQQKQIEVFLERGKGVPSYVPSSLKEGLFFLQRFISSPESVGSIFPSSSGLIDAMTSKVSFEVEQSTLPRRYLDVGAGTGSFTEGIIAKMRPQDQLDVVEYDENLCKFLQRRFQHLPNVHVHHVSIFEFKPPYQYDVVVTGLPLNNFSSDAVASAFKKYEELTRPGGSFCYFEYLFLPTLSRCFRKVFGSNEEVENFEKILEIKSRIQQQFQTDADTVYWNLTPARAIHFYVPKTN